MVSRKGYQFRIYPNKKQEIFFTKTFGCVRFLYNHMLDDKIKYYEETKKMKQTTPASGETKLHDKYGQRKYPIV